MTLLSIDGRVCRMAEPPPLRVALHLLLADEPLPEWPLPLAVYALDDQSDRSQLVYAMMTGGLRLDDLHSMADGVAAEWFRQPRWTARALWREFQDNYSRADGDLLLAGVDVETLPLPRATNAVLALFVRWYREDKDALDAFARRISTQPKRLTSLGRSTTADDARRAHRALMSAAGQAGRARGAPNVPEEQSGGSVLRVRE